MRHATREDSSHHVERSDGADPDRPLDPGRCARPEGAGHVLRGARRQGPGRSRCSRGLSRRALRRRDSPARQPHRPGRRARGGAARVARPVRLRSRRLAGLARRGGRPRPSRRSDDGRCGRRRHPGIAGPVELRPHDRGHAPHHRVRCAARSPSAATIPSASRSSAAWSRRARSTSCTSTRTPTSSTTSTAHGSAARARCAGSANCRSCAVSRRSASATSTAPKSTGCASSACGGPPPST